MTKKFPSSHLRHKHEQAMRHLDAAQRALDVVWAEAETNSMSHDFYEAHRTLDAVIRHLGKVDPKDYRCSHSYDTYRKDRVSWLRQRGRYGED